jgi:hypothetical protein
MEQTTVYNQKHINTQDEPSGRLPDITLPDMMNFVSVALKMGHTMKDTLHDCWSRLKQLHSPFYGVAMMWNRFLHTLLFPNFADNSQRHDEGEKCDKLWKISSLFKTEKDLAVNEITVNFKGRVVFRQ